MTEHFMNPQKPFLCALRFETEIVFSPLLFRLVAKNSSIRKSYMLEGARTYTLMDKMSRWAFSLLIIPIAYFFLSHQGHYTWIDNFDLIIHEPGHFFFSFMGDTIHMLGGTLMQLIVPTLLIIYGFRAHRVFVTQFFMCFLAQNLINISVYAGDAVTMKLRLLGPPGAKHDWHYLLLKYNMLDMTADISMFFLVMAGITFLIAILAPLYIKD